MDIPQLLSVIIPMSLIVSCFLDIIPMLRCQSSQTMDLAFALFYFSLFYF